MLWILGVILFLLMVATGFMGYVLPWGQMSFWAATVITNLFSAIPGVGDPIVTWLWGGYRRRQSDAQSLLLAALPVAVRHRRRGRAAHLGAAYGRPEQPDRRRAEGREGYRRVHALRDREGRLLHRAVLHLFFAWFVFYIPNYLGHSDNYIPANPGQTPTAYRSGMVLPAVLRHSARDPDKLLGVIALAGSIVLLAFLPWLDTSRVRSANYRPLYRQFLLIFFVARHRPGLSRLAGSRTGRLRDRGADPHRLLFRLPASSSCRCSGLFEKTKPLPNSISESVLREGVPVGASAPPPSGAKA